MLDTCSPLFTTAGANTPAVFKSDSRKHCSRVNGIRGQVPSAFPERESGCLDCQSVRGLAITMSHARALALERFRWIGSHADVWKIFRDPGALAAVVRGLVGPFRDDGVTAVCGIESRGFLLGAAVAVELGVGFVAVRKGEGIFPGEKRLVRKHGGNAVALLLKVVQPALRSRLPGHSSGAASAAGGGGPRGPRAAGRRLGRDGQPGVGGAVDGRGARRAVGRLLRGR